jgi:hypothetical protein
VALKLNSVETEVVLLKAVQELVETMVNFNLFQILGQDPDSQIAFHSSTHQRFFNIILVDFLSATDKQAPVRRTTYLGGLREIAARPSFDAGNYVALLETATTEFVSWLEQKVEIATWFPSINIHACLKVSRLDFLKMCGNISKHNFLKAIGVATDLQELLSNSGVSATMEQALLALADFHERFHADILNYHTSTIAEFLNNIRWGIYEYLQPEFRRSIVWEGGDPPKYRYTYPPEVQAPLAQECYWELMNEVRSPPFMRRFQVAKCFNVRY